jgi:hypothetical protein
MCYGFLARCQATQENNIGDVRVAHSHSQYFYGKSTLRSVCTVELYLACSSTEALYVAMDTQECVPFALLTYRIFQNFVNNINVLMLSCKVSVILSDFNQIWGISADFRRSSQHRISHRFVQSEPRC